MALADFTAYKSAQASPSQVVDFAKTWTIPAGTLWSSSWLGTGTGSAGVAPSGAASIPDRTTIGALGQFDPSGELRAWLGRVEHGIAGTLAGITLMLVDRLAHKGGLDGTSTGAQTVSTPALTRFTDGVGVFAAVEVYTPIGATPTTATIAYDSDSTPGQTSPAIAVGGTGLQNAARVLPFSVAAGDRGVKAVTSVTLAGTTGTAGNFGITLYKRLAMLHVGTGTDDFGAKGDPLADMGGWMPVIPAGACLQWLALAGGAFTPVLAGTLNFFED